MSLSERYSRSSVGSSIAKTGSWPARTPIEATAAPAESISTSSEKISPSGVRTSAWNLVRATISALLGCLDDFLDRALQEEGTLGDLVVLAVDDLLEAADRFGDRHICAGGAG